MALARSVAGSLFQPGRVGDHGPPQPDHLGIGSLQIILDKGQEVDWFSATWIRWTTLLLVGTLIGFLYRELTIRQPLVDLRVFLDRNFAMGCLLIALFGGVIVANAETNQETVADAPLILDGFDPSPGVVTDRFDVMKSVPGGAADVTAVLERLIACATMVT